MTFEFEDRKHENTQLPNNLSAPNPGHTHQLISIMNTQKRDRFELLSAYLDGEVTATERRQVEEWLDKDVETQRLYSRLLNLRSNFQSLPVPSAQPVEQTIGQVFGKIDKRRRHRSVAWGGAAIAAMVVAALSSVVPGRQVWQMANVNNSAASEPLYVALNTPVVEIPDTVLAPAHKSAPAQPAKLHQQNN
ncbi:anti-sigma factor family protein [Aliterella atlantica]|uniref:Putative zinc-finger domain-containing protein n=1 Tax=Aliterella atlantica CENA595 TaxID=1618023 RepID=A0A0D8ZPD0_9CYAN|nr:zf-HC2 domain-containing protein [Aliterella atlantica]KJH70182.1 hypothetical protein UH38_19500 [Aliterella atlantica CENA595]